MYRRINATALSIEVGNGRWIEVSVTSELGQLALRDGVELVVRDPFAGTDGNFEAWAAACDEVLSLDF